MTVEELYGDFIHKSRYARYLENQKRRETWQETVDRYIDFMSMKAPSITQETWHELKDAIITKQVMPSMRALMTAGPALDRDNTCGYNCSYLVADDPKAFDEAMFILMCGTGVGFSVERQYINKLPEVPERLYSSDTVIKVADSKEGWSKAFRMLIALLYAGEKPRWDVTKVRAAGERLKQFGGRASGPQPLVDLFEFTVNLFDNAAGRRLSSIECHDLFCKIGEIVVVGGVRRSAMISLSNLTDDRMRHAKSGEWWNQNKQRALANNSVSFTEKPDVGAFLREWTSLYESKSGERGIFNRVASQKQAEKYGRRDPNHEFGTNPCSEIILRPYQFCNLTEVVIRPNDDKDSLCKKVRLASILGTIQATMVDFPYLRKVWQNNTAEERLLGVSLTGIMDNALTNTVTDEAKDILNAMREAAVAANAEHADMLGIPRSTAITCVKPSGTVSQLVDAASGIHTRHSDFYFRTVRGDNKDPLTQFMVDKGIHAEPDVMNPDTTTVLTFPIMSPQDALTRDSLTAVEHLELWKMYQEHWCEHKPSITISVKEDEWPEVGAWVFNNFDDISGISFLPHDGGSYRQAPYQEVKYEEYIEMANLVPSKINWDEMIEEEDTTTGSQELACSAGSCEII
jgi:ribonucleoside-triphosphate reductase